MRVVRLTGWILGFLGVAVFTGGCRATVGQECLNRMSECVRLCAPEQPGSDRTPMPTVWVDQRRECERRRQDLCAPEPTPQPSPTPGTLP